MAEVDVRPCRSSDSEFLFQVREAAFRRYIEQVYGAWNEVAQRLMHRDGFRPRDTQIIVVDGTEVGWIEIHDRGHELYLANIYLLPQAQGHGVGAYLIGQLLDRGRQERRPVTLRVLKVNPARRLYERLGFRHDFQIETHYYMRYDPPPPTDGRQQSDTREFN